MLPVSKKSSDKVEKRGVVEDEDGYKCAVCGSPIMYVSTGRSLWDSRFRPSQAGYGKVIQVEELYCPKCDGEPELPRYGTGIYDDELATRNLRVTHMSFLKKLKNKVFGEGKND